MTTGSRIAAGIALAVFLVSALALGAQYLLVKRDLLARQQALVQADLDGFSALYDQRRVIAVRQAIEFRKLAGTDALLVLLDRDGAVLAATGDWPDLAVPDEGQSTGPLTITHAGQPHLAVARTLPGGFAFLVARPTAETRATLATLRRIIALSLAGIALIGGATGLLASRYIMARVNRLNVLVNTVAGGDLSARIPDPSPGDEFGVLQDHMHHMLDRIEALHRATHHLSDTVAHELRTPLTRIQARLSRLPAGPDTDALQDEIRTTVRIFESLLEIARAEADAGTRSDPQPLDLSQLLAEICELYEPLAETRALTFGTAITDGVRILGDRNLIAQLISNLLENALKFTPPGESVTVTLTPGDPRHILRIADTGPGLPPGFEAKVFDRFARAAPQGDTPGHGLGLALVKAVALRHGAKLTLPATEKGFVIEIAWPKIAGTE